MLSAYIDSLTPREAKLLNTYTNAVNKGKFKDDDTYKHDENEIDYKKILKRKLDYIPADYEEFMGRVRETTNMPIEEKYHRAALRIYEIENALDKPDRYDKSWVNTLIYDFEKYIDDFEHIDEAYELIEDDERKMDEAAKEDD